MRAGRQTDSRHEEADSRIFAVWRRRLKYKKKPQIRATKLSANQTETGRNTAVLRGGTESIIWLGKT